MIVFYNPHVDDFLSEPPHFSLIKRKALKKYRYIFDGVLEENKKIEVFLDYTMSALFSPKIFLKLPFFIRKTIVKIEVRKWLRDNKFENKIKFISETECHNKFLFAMSYKAAQGDFQIKAQNLNKFKACIFHLSHYFALTCEKSLNLSKIENLYLSGDSDITNNDYFKKYFSWYKKQFFIIPFSVAERFSCIKEFRNRDVKLVATGSFHDLKMEMKKNHYLDYMSFYQCSTYHPIRKEIFQNRYKLNDIFSIKISPYTNRSKFSFLKKFIVNQKKYFSFDIVELYNQHRYAVVGEENTGFLAIGALESMGCGCILLAQEKCYKGLGLIDGIHYVSYDGTLPNLIEKFHQLNEMPIQELEKISQASVDFMQNYKSKKSYENFKNAISLLTNNI